MRTSSWAVALSMLVGAFVQAPEGVDFTGRWILESRLPAPAETPRALSVRQSLVTRNVRGELMRPFFNEIAIDREFETGTRAERHQIGIEGGTIVGVVGGSAGAPMSTSAAAIGSNRHYAVKWDANAMVFESGSYTGHIPETGVWIERREVWSVDSDGRLHVVITTRGSNDAPNTVAAVYRRQ
jgi:hypothetical protein